MGTVILVIHYLLSAYSLAVVGRVFLEMLLSPYNRVVAFLRRITEPLLAPIRRFVPPLRTGGMAWDLSPVIALLLLWVLEQLLTRLLVSVAR